MAEFNFYKKYNLDFDEITIDNTKGTERFSVKNSFFEHELDFPLEYFLKIIDKKLLLKIPPCKASLTKIIYPGVLPHCDGWPVSLNYYVNSGIGETFFYDLKYKEMKVKYPSTYSETWLNMIHSFKPETKSLYLFNTHIIHSVKIQNNESPRYIFRLIWQNNTFNEIEKSIELR